MTKPVEPSAPRRSQRWVCEKCGESGYVFYVKGAGVMEVVHKLEDSHARKSPACDQPVRRLQLITPKTRRVRVKAQVVNSDGTPVNGSGVEYGRGWQKNLEWKMIRRKVKP